MSFPLNISCFWLNSTEKQPIAFPAKTATGKKPPSPGKYSVTKPRKKNVGSYQQLISSIGNKLFPPTMYLSVQLRMFWNPEHPGSEVHWEVPGAGSQKERQQPRSPGTAKPSDKKEIHQKSVGLPWFLAGCSVPRQFRSGAVRRAKWRGQVSVDTKPRGWSDDLQGSLPTYSKLFLVQKQWHLILVS